VTARVLVFLCAVCVFGCRAEEPRKEVTATPAAASSAPRVVLLLSLDTLRADHLGFYGYERFTSPVLDMVAAEGVVFEDASSTSPWTLPSHASLLTGRYPRSHGVVSMRTGLPGDVPTLARLLGSAGFDTAAVVNSTWLKREDFALTRDFERYLFVQDVPDRRAPNTWVTDQAIEWLGEAREGPLFLFVHYYDVHSDYVSQPGYERLFVTPYDGEVDGSGWQLTRANLEDDYLEMCHNDFDPEKCTFGSQESPWVVDSSVERLVLTEADVRHLVELYDAGIRQLDTELSRLFAWMRKEGVLDETLLVITSDHGEEFMEHGRVDHFLPMWQEILRVPFVIRGPGIPAGVRVEAAVSHVDIVPTVLTLADVPVPAAVDGLDLSPLWREGAAGSAADVGPFADRFLYGEGSGGLTYDLVVRGFFPVFRSVRRGRHKLLYDSKSGSYSLFDLAADPGERNDRLADEPQVARQLMDEMKARYRDFTPDVEPANPVELSPEEIERLRALGYMR
jgi:arylsulfatase A-like enzyme